MRILLHARSLAEPLLAGSLNSRDLPALAAQAGFTGVEWLDRLLPSYGQAQWEELAGACQIAGLGPGALSLGLELEASPALVAEQVDRIKLLLGRAPRLGVDTVRIAIGGAEHSLSRLLLTLEALRHKEGRDANPLGALSRWVYARAVRRMNRGWSPHHSLPPRVDEARLQSAAWALQPLARMAQEMGLRLGLENHFGLTSHPEDMLALIELAAPAELGLCLDLGNFHPEQEPMAVCGLLAPKAVHVHFKLHEPSAEEQARRAHYPAVLEGLRQNGFEGGFSVEYEGPGDGLAAAATGRELLLDLWEGREAGLTRAAT